MREPLFFHPFYQERVWGGRSLETLFGRTLPPQRQIGESWEIVDRPEAQSTVAAGALAGQSLRQVLQAHAAEVLGPKWPADRRFPLLVKWLDCRERLSLQVHPPIETAALLGGESKTENWYIAHTGHGAQVLAGLKPGVTRGQFEKALAAHAVEELMHRIPVVAGDSIFVPSGLIHALDAGTLILEIQENSDTTYRVHDWGRVGLDGRPRQLHHAESMASIQWDSGVPAVVRAAPTSGVLAECDAFLIRRVVLGPHHSLLLAAGEQPRIVSAVSGDVAVAGAGSKSSHPLPRGANVLLPYAGAFTFTAKANAIVLLTENFSSV